MKKFLSAKLAALLILLCACGGPQIHYNQLIALNPGMAEAETLELLKLPPLSVHDTMVAEDRYRFQRYQMNNGVTSSLYLIAFKNDKLAYWGYVDEFRKHPDQALQRALDQVFGSVMYDYSKPKKKKSRSAKN